MRALLLRETGGPDALALEELPDLDPDPSMVLIEVHAAGVGFVDLLMSRGEYQVRPELPFVPGIEVAGVVVRAPEGSGLIPGGRVAATTAFGAFAELAAAPDFLTFPLPDDMDFDVGAGMVVNYQTAHLGLWRRGRLAEGETVLVPRRWARARSSPSPAGRPSARWRSRPEPTRRSTRATTGSTPSARRPTAGAPTSSSTRSAATASTPA
jgi:D-arabinose 1-dehydrogenase-like Zn-dependent alcohol dehydrogenase